jgi:hypothetical protein
MAAQRYMHVDNLPPDLLSGVSNVILYPMQSASVFLWYIQVLTLYFLIVPWFMQMSEKITPWALLFLGIFLYKFEWTEFLNISGFVQYLPFFAAGILIGQYWWQLSSNIAMLRYGPLWGVPFIAAIAYGLVIQPLPKWFVGVLAIPAVLLAARNLHGKMADSLRLLGNNTFCIYLMNTIFIGLTKGFLLPFIPWRDYYFVLYFVILTAAGLLFPILMKKFLVKRQPRVAAYIS